MRRAFYAVLFAMMMGLCAGAQDKPAPEKASPETAQEKARPAERPLSFYKLEFVLRELQDGKAINSRTYMMTVENNDRGDIRTGARVPVQLGSPPMPTQYMDVGININCRVVGRDDYVSLRSTIDVSSFAIPEQATSPGTQPVVRSMRTEMAAVVPVGKPTVIGTIDDVNSTKRYEIGVTATRMK